MIILILLILILLFIAILICSIPYQFYIAPLVDENEKLFDYNNHLLDELYNRSGDGTLVDNAWTCGCGQLNAEYRQECGKCNQPKR